MDKKAFKLGLGLLLLFLIIYVGSLINWIFHPIIVTLETLFIPGILSIFLFYLLRPIVKVINKKLPIWISILLVYFIVIFIIVGLLIIMVPILQRQFNSLINNMPFIINQIQNRFIGIQQSGFLQPSQLGDILNLEDLISKLTDLINQFGKNLVSSMANFIGTLANTVFVLIIVPFILFYLLKDGEKFWRYILSLFKKQYKNDIKLIFTDIDKVLSSYIQGQGLVCLCVGTLCFIAFLITGLEYSLLLAVIAGLTNIIPYFGPWIGSVPAVIVGLFQSPIKALVIVVLIVIIQQIESNFISPQIIGKKLKIHPINIMFLILISGRLFGLIGMVLIVPFYGICRVIFIHSLRIYKKIKK